MAREQLLKSLLPRHPRTDEGNSKRNAAEGMDIPTAIVTQLCTMIGASVALVGWYMKLAGYIGFFLALGVVTMTSVLVHEAIMETCMQTGATNFTQLCSFVPAWVRRLSETCSIVWGLIAVGLYECYTFNALDTELFHGSLPREVVYVMVGVMTYAICLPTKFEGPMTQVPTRINFVATWTVIFVAAGKGISVYLGRGTASIPAVEYSAFTDLRSFVQAVVLLTGSMVYCGGLPQLASEVAPASRTSACRLVPLWVALLQAFIFTYVGVPTYLALGNRSDGNSFKAYSDDDRDRATVVLQVGLAVMSYLSMPLIMIPAKMQLSFALSRLQRRRNPRQQKTIGEINGPLTVALCIVTTLMPWALDEQAFLRLCTIVAGTFAVILNLFLPAVILYYAQVLPAWSTKKKWREALPASLMMAWFFVLGLLLATSTLHELWQ